MPAQPTAQDRAPSPLVECAPRPKHAVSSTIRTYGAKSAFYTPSNQHLVDDLPRHRRPPEHPRIQPHDRARET